MTAESAFPPPPVKPPVYLRLFHGRTDPAENLDDWGSDGPVFGPLYGVNGTYRVHLKFEEIHEGDDDYSFGDLAYFEDLIYYDGAYYGDFAVCAYLDPGETTTRFDQAKSVRPEGGLSITPIAGGLRVQRQA